MIRLLRGSLALAALLAGVFAAPWALLSWGRPVPGAGWFRPDDGSWLLVVLTWVGWLAWLAFTLATLAEVSRLVSGVRWHLPGLGGVQRASAGLLMAVLALAPSQKPEAPVTPTGVVLSEPDPLDSVLDQEEPLEAVSDYLVADGDDLWSISEGLFGDGARWRELVAANPDRLPDPTARLAAGTRLRLPESVTPVVVRRGDTLSGLALEHLGAARRWPIIAAANRDLVEDPDHIEVGWTLNIPGARHAPSQAKPPVSREQPNEPELVEPTVSPEPATPRPVPEEPAPITPTVPEEPAPITPTVPEEPAQPASRRADDLDAARRLVGVFGSVAAAAVIGTLEVRRRLRMRERPIGRRLVGMPDQPLRAGIGGQQQPDRMAGLDAALRAVSRHCFEQTIRLPGLQRVLLAETEVVLELSDPCPALPAGFTGTPIRWHALFADLPDEHAWSCAYPAVVSLGSTSSGETVLVDAERSRVLGVSAASAELRRASLAAIGVELACAPWSQEARLVAAGADADLIGLAGQDRAELAAGPAELLDRVRAAVAERRSHLAGQPLAELRVDPDRAEAVTPLVFWLGDDLDADTLTELDILLAGPATGVVVILGTESEAPAQWQVGGDEYAPTGRLVGRPGMLLAHGIPAASRSGLAALLRAADDPASTPAPWWSRSGRSVRRLPRRAMNGDEPMDVVRLLPETPHPRLLLIGPTELVGAQGPAPERSRQQLMEMCAWLLDHPGSTATAMTAGMSLAESTRRSNLSRLRSWLGSDPSGALYLPDAYSGRIRLHDLVDSDWQHLQLLLHGGADRASDSVLTAALELIRGAPLADASPSQWHWAEDLRTDIASTLRDVGLVLTDRALEAGDLDLARWAASRALVVAPEDEQLLCARIRTEHRAGNRAEVDRLVAQVTRQARVLGVDLLPETVNLCQEVVEGRVRARLA